MQTAQRTLWFEVPRAWYERLHKYLVKIGFERTDDNRNLNIKTKKVMTF